MPFHSTRLQQRLFLLLLALVTLAFGAILLPFYGAVFWAAVLAILFAPLQRRLVAATGHRRNVAALLSLLTALVIVILPMALVTTSLLHEGSVIYDRIRSGQIDFGAYFAQAVDMLPHWVSQALDNSGLADLADIRRKLSTGAMEGSQTIARQALTVGQSTFNLAIAFVVMLYLLFFLLRDGPVIARRIREAVPLQASHKRQLFEKFTTVIRATIKGNIVVAAIQGALGGVMFWFLGIPGVLLWGTIMAFLSLLPSIGAALVWGPVALYFLFTGAIWQGVLLVLWGSVVIGLVDNLLRPLLVGKDTQMPDYVVLVSTLGGMALLGLNGFVIGPVVAALFIAAWDLFDAEQNEP
ncbi:MAG: AI-2E family transporter [Burkholderiaceae bacterium]